MVAPAPTVVYVQLLSLLSVFCAALTTVKWLQSEVEARFWWSVQQSTAKRNCASSVETGRRERATKRWVIQALSPILAPAISRLISSPSLRKGSSVRTPAPSISPPCSSESNTGGGGEEGIKRGCLGPSCPLHFVCSKRRTSKKEGTSQANDGHILSERLCERACQTPFTIDCLASLANMCTQRYRTSSLMAGAY
mmetsp:Transcript_29182/g.75116  ORF Transcript_29182/g.75116 Transcript_29182/m.75116 type:complete len:195 (+) Transcript_29182:1513-2097(+)